MESEIQRGETIYVLKLNRKELGYLAHVIKKDDCGCDRWECSSIDCANDILALADSERIEY